MMRKKQKAPPPPLLNAKKVKILNFFVYYFIIGCLGNTLCNDGSILFEQKVHFLANFKVGEAKKFLKHSISL